MSSLYQELMEAPVCPRLFIPGRMSSMKRGHRIIFKGTVSRRASTVSKVVARLMSGVKNPHTTPAGPLLGKILIPGLTASKQWLNYKKHALKSIKDIVGSPAKVETYWGNVHLIAEYTPPDRSSVPDMDAIICAASELVMHAGIIGDDKQILSFDFSRIHVPSAERAGLTISLLRFVPGPCDFIR